MTKNNNTIENFPPDKIEKNWPFGQFMAMVRSPFGRSNNYIPKGYHGTFL